MPFSFPKRKKPSSANDQKLISSAYNGNLQEVRDLLRAGANVNAQRDDGTTALYVASKFGYLEVVRELLRNNKVDVNIQRTSGSTALYIASCNDHVEVVRELLQNNKVDVNLQCTDGATALYVASYNGHVKVVRELLQNNKVDVNLPMTNGSTALYVASELGHLEVVRELLRNNKVDVNLQNTNGATALYMASQNGHVLVVCELLQNNKVDVNLQRTTGATALYIASQEGHVNVVRELLQNNKVDVNLPMTNGSTALYVASELGHVKVVRELLQNNKVDVNLPMTNGSTALYVASQNGHFEVVRELLQNNKVDVNLQTTGGATALYIASCNGHVEVVRKLLLNNKLDLNLQHTSGFTALDIALHQKHDDVVCLLIEHKEEEMNRLEKEEQSGRRPTETGAQHRVTIEPPRRNDDSPSIDDAKIEQDRSKLLYVMNTSSADPAELSLEYIKRCLTDYELGKGAFGDVFLAEDCRLPKKFAVKMISPTHRDEAAINEIRKSFHKELLTLKTFRHPNIIVLYGYSLNANSTQQCLVYEYATNGSLTGFFTDDGNRARLSADTRLSIMFKLVRAVHFLHTGGCKVSGKGWNVFHRDIKSANICLADDFTPRLIDCGLAKFVPDDNSRVTPGSLQSKSSGLIFGTPGYICPEYSRKKIRGLPCPYIAAYDVYSIGVVLVEIILGCLNGGQSMRNDSQFHDVFDMYVKDERDRLIIDGCDKLKRDADPFIIWNLDALELVCKAAIQCMAPFPEERLSTRELLDKLRDAIFLNTNVGLQHPLAETAVDSGTYCLICNEYRTDIKCSEGHALCTACILEKLGDDNGCDFLCLIKECSSKLPMDDLYGRTPRETYDRFLAKREDQTKWDECLRRLVDLMRSDFSVVKVGVEHTQESLQKQQHMIQRLAKGLNRSLAALALLSSNQFKECPNLVWLNPIAVENNVRYTPKKWIRDEALQKYSVVFICAHSGEPGHEAFEIEVPRRWIVKVAPWLKLCLQAIKAVATSQGLPFPIPNLTFLEQYELMKSFFDSAVEKTSTAVLAHCEALLENGTMSIDTYGQMQTLAGDTFKFIAEKARANTNWKARMVPVCRHNGTPIWVKSTYEAHYEV